MSNGLGLWVQARFTGPGSTGTVTVVLRVPRNTPSGALSPTWNLCVIQPDCVGVHGTVARPKLSVYTGAPTVLPASSSRYTGTPEGAGSPAHWAKKHAPE
ncbi:unannotated protein [freshwater metagenome]|uniref:Unannotated protein n=1 Tax=freshwater metagenome TaxID=449393 RepID=A0A6J5YG48_9ZZZZ